MISFPTDCVCVLVVCKTCLIYMAHLVCVYVYVYMYVCTNLCVCACACACVCVCVCGGGNNKYIHS